MNEQIRFSAFSVSSVHETSYGVMMDLSLPPLTFRSSVTEAESIHLAIVSVTHLTQKVPACRIAVLLNLELNEILSFNFPNCSFRYTKRQTECLKLTLN